MCEVPLYPPQRDVYQCQHGRHVCTPTQAVLAQDLQRGHESDYTGPRAGYALLKASDHGTREKL